MIIKSLSRKSRQVRSARSTRGGKTPFSALVSYMNRDFGKEDDRAVLWHNFYGSERTPAEEIVQEFETNAARLRERANGNVLYHEILSFSSGYELSGEELERAIADIGQEYLRERAPEQLAYGVIHRGTDHAHLHLMVSANRIGSEDRVRLSKKEFSEIQKRIESFVIERYPGLSQEKVYDRDFSRERMKTDVREQAMKSRTKQPSRKEQLKARLHQAFARADSIEDLSRLMNSEGFTIYQRGKSIGVVVREADGQERRHRLSSLGVEEHYLAANARFAAAPDRTPPVRESVREPDTPSPTDTRAEHDDQGAALRQEVDEMSREPMKPQEKQEPVQKKRPRDFDRDR